MFDRVSFRNDAMLLLPPLYDGYSNGSLLTAVVNGTCESPYEELSKVLNAD